MKELLKIVNKIYNLIDKYQIVVFGVCCLIFVLIFAILLFKIKKIPVFEIELFLIPILIIAFDRIMYYVVGREYHLENNGWTLMNIAVGVFAICLVVALISLVVRLLTNKGKVVPPVVNERICMIYNLDNQEFKYTDYFDTCFSKVSGIKNKWTEVYEELYIDDEAVELNELAKYLKDINKTKFTLRIRIKGDKEITFNIQKETNGQNCVDYLLEDYSLNIATRQVTDNTEIKNDAVSIAKHFETLDEPIGTYDVALGQYRLTRRMRKKLNIDAVTIDPEDYRNFVYYEDYVTYDALRKQTEGSYKYKYRLKTIDGLEWYEEVKVIKNGNVISNFHKAKLEKVDVAIFNKDDLIRDLDKRIAASEVFGLIFIFIENASDLIHKNGLEAGNVLISNYFKNIQKNLLSNDDSIYKMNDSEYCIIVSNVSAYEELIYQVSLGKSELLGNTSFLERNQCLSNTLGFVYSKDVIEKNSIEYIEAGKLLLYLAINKKKAKYIVYGINEITNDDEEFEKYKVDLDNTFLNDL